MTSKTQQAVYTLVVGLGKTGLSVVRYLRALGEAVVVVDSRDIPPGLTVMRSEFSDVQCVTGKFDAALFNNAHRIVVSPGVTLKEPVLVEAGNKSIEIIGDIDLFSREVEAPVIGITGSNGKSTVTTLLREMAVATGKKAVACGNIGLPVLDTLDDDVELYVMELSSFQLESLHCLSMKAAVVLNISADHLDRYDSIASYALSKQMIYQDAQTLVVNKDDELASKVIFSDRPVLSFTMQQPAENEFGIRANETGEQCIYFGQTQVMTTAQLKLKGLHNIQNALAALALGYVAGLSLDAMVDTLKSFVGLPHRMQFVAEHSGVNWVNDSKATNVGAAVAALAGLPGKQVLIAGGASKGADFAELAEAISLYCRAVVLIGEDADLIAQVIDRSMPVVKAVSMDDAVASAAPLALPGDNVLLAPACASFDMFDNFEQRGDVFMQSVARLYR